MPVFNPKLFSKKNKEKRVKNNNTYKILTKNIKGICCITSDAEYFIVTDNGNYKFSDDSYIIQKDKPFYSQQLIEGKRLQVRELKVRKTSNKETFLPFAPGVTCIGDIIYNEITKNKVFRLKDTYIDNTSSIAIDAWHFFVDNYPTIRKVIENGNK